MAGGPLAPPVQPNVPGVFEPDRARVLMAFAGPAKQNRLTVFFRYILAIPQLIVLSFVGIAAEIVLVIGWFGALFMGRLPRFAADFLPGYLRWQVRVYAYLALLTGQYPPFTFDDVDYPIRVAVRPGQLNRLAVLLRIVLAIPAAIVVQVVTLGLDTIGLFITWLIVLFAGTMPMTLHQAIAAITRYQTRLTGYLLLLTAEYPAGLFGDRPAAGEGASAVVPGYGGAPGYGEVPPAHGSGPPAPADGAALVDQNPWRLVLTSPPRRLVGGFVVLGVLVWVLLGVLIGTVFASTSGAAARSDAIAQSQVAYTQLSGANRTFAATTATCQNSSQPLSCVTNADQQVAQSFGTFEQAIRGISMPSGSVAAADQLASVAGQAQQVFEQLSKSTSAGQYQQTAQSSNLTQLLNQLDQDYTNLGRSLIQ